MIASYDKVLLTLAVQRSLSRPIYSASHAPYGLCDNGFLEYSAFMRGHPTSTPHPRYEQISISRGLGNDIYSVVIFLASI